MSRSLIKLAAIFATAVLTTGYAAAQPSPDRYLPRFENPDPSAVEYGLLFEARVPAETRKMIVDDLVWLHSLGPLKNVQMLNRLEVITSTDNVTGADLVAWLFARVKVIAKSPWCPSDYQVVVNGSRADRPPAVFKISNVPCGPIDPIEEEKWSGWALGWHEAHNYHPWRKADRVSKEMDGYRIGDLIMIEPQDAPVLAPPVVFVTDNFSWTEWSLGNERLSSMDLRARRLETLFHEAKHTESAASHVACTGWEMPPMVRFGVEKDISDAIDRPDESGMLYDCDNGISGAHTMGALILDAIASNCPICSTTDLLQIREDEIDRWRMIGVPLRAVTSVPDEIVDPSTFGLRGRKFSSAPPEMIFDALQARSDLLVKSCREKHPGTGCKAEHSSEIGALSAFLARIDAAGGFASNWSGSARKTPEWRDIQQPATGSWSDEWIRRAPGAAAVGYNLPMKWARPCADYAKGC